MNTLICPISKEKVNKPAVRITGFIIAVFAALYGLTGSLYFVLIIFADFIIRAFTSLRYSPISFLAAKLAKLLRFKPHMIDKAPKLFASRVGFLFTLTAIILYPLSIGASQIVLLILMAFALLEAVFDFCVGCVVYTYIILPLSRRSETKPEYSHQ